MALLVGFPYVWELIRLYQVNKVIHVYIRIILFMFCTLLVVHSLSIILFTLINYIFPVWSSLWNELTVYKGKLSYIIFACHLIRVIVHHTCKPAHKHTCILPVHMYIHTYKHINIHIYIHTYIQTYILTYIHTYIHTYMHNIVYLCIRTWMIDYTQTCCSLTKALSSGRNVAT